MILKVSYCLAYRSHVLYLHGDGFIAMCNKKPDVSYKPELYMLHKPTRTQMYVHKYTPGGTFDV